jgi:hypothetical protein
VPHTGRQKIADAANNGINPGYLAHELVIGGCERRFAAGEMTSQWIVFANGALGKNYYLAPGEHEEGDAAISE